jgi:GNAT superfamily N-acetyltransferase
LAADDADFDLTGRGEPLRPLSAEAVERYLANPAVLHWVALEVDAPVGNLYRIHLPLRARRESELLLYEIGVHRRFRRRTVGRSLIERAAWSRAFSATSSGSSWERIRW